MKTRTPPRTPPFTRQTEVVDGVERTVLVAEMTTFPRSMFMSFERPDLRTLASRMYCYRAKYVGAAGYADHVFTFAMRRFDQAVLMFEAAMARCDRAEDSLPEAILLTHTFAESFYLFATLFLRELKELKGFEDFESSPDGGHAPHVVHLIRDQLIEHPKDYRVNSATSSTAGPIVSPGSAVQDLGLVPNACKLADDLNARLDALGVPRIQPFKRAMSVHAEGR
jgi:hypothetical protein